MKEPRVVFGFHAVLARLRADPKSVLEIFVDETRNDGRMKDLVAAAQRSSVPVHKVPTRRLDGFYGGGRHQGVVARVDVKKVSVVSLLPGRGGGRLTAVSGNQLEKAPRRTAQRVMSVRKVRKEKSAIEPSRSFAS